MKYNFSELCAMMICAAAIVGIAFIIVFSAKCGTITNLESELKKQKRENDTLRKENFNLQEKYLLILRKEQSK